MVNCQPKPVIFYFAQNTYIPYGLEQAYIKNIIYLHLVNISNLITYIFKCIV